MKKRILLISTVFIILTFIFFSYEAYFSPDSCYYYYLSLIFDKTVSFSQWRAIRGFTLPLYLFISNNLFGNSLFGITLGLYILNLVMHISVFIILKSIISNEKWKKYETKITILYIILLVLNPIIIGYSHIVLTETLAPVIALLSVWLSICWYRDNLPFKKNWYKKIFYVTMFCVLAVLMWFLKQPYLPIIIFIVLITSILSLIKSFNIKNILYRLITLICIILSIMISIKCWNNILKIKGVDTSITSTYVSNSFIGALSNYYKEDLKEYKTKFDFNGSLLSIVEQQKILDLINGNENKNYKVYNIYDKDKLIDQELIIYEGNSISIKDSMLFFVKQIFKHPILIMKSYYHNYMTTIDLHAPTITGNSYTAGTKLTQYDGENKSLALFVIYDGPAYWWKWYIDDNSYEEYEQNYDYSSYMKQFEVTRNTSGILRGYFENVFPIYNTLFKFIFLICPIITIITFVYYIKTKFNETYMIATILFGSSFLHVLFHTVTGAIIDRYAYIAFPLLLLGLILLLFPKNKKNISKNNESFKFNERKYKKMGSKILFVIPAYNEAKNIEKVLNEIKTDVNYADILVINDCSTDNTKEIVEKNNIKCITNIFNMRYAMAVQTGIKYAYENDYDFVIQFDADGQHIAKEAIKMIEKQKETNCDIVIGSRYIVDTGYPCPTFRKIGTKFFSFLIKLFCKKKIADPLSGFQLLNRNVIEYYSKMGNYPEFPDANLAMEMLYNGYKIEEVPVKMRLRESGESMHGGIIKPIKYMIKIFYTICFIVIKNNGRKEDE